MARFPGWLSVKGTLMTLGVTGSAVASLVMSAPASAVNFPDVQTHWARPYIEGLAKKNIVIGFDDGTFKPEQAVTRAEFAALVQKAFNSSEIRDARSFNDVSPDYWAKSMIEEAYATGFITGYPHRTFNPEEPISKVQVLVSLVSGLHIPPKNWTQNVLNTYVDADQIPEYALDKVAIATEKAIVVNYPNTKYLNPNQVATRGDVAALIYQAKVSMGALPQLDSQSDASNYIVHSTSENNQANNIGSKNQNIQSNQLKLAKSREINVITSPSQKVIVTPNESVNMKVMVASDIKNSRGEVLIPQSSQISGQLIPRYSGTDFLGHQFVAQKLIIGNQSYNNFNATSFLITGQQITTVNPETLQGAAVSPKAQEVIQKVTEKEVNAAENSVANKEQPNKLIAIDQKQDWTLTLGSDFYANSAADARK